MPAGATKEDHSCQDQPERVNCSKGHGMLPFLIKVNIEMNVGEAKSHFLSIFNMIPCFFINLAIPANQRMLLKWIPISYLHRNLIPET
jgi:hypothetical protein